MSIPPVNKPSDYDKFFSRYLADLSLQVKLNQENYDANVTFFKTGVQATERTDSRSIEQRSTDVETLKIQARTMLNKLTDSNSASEVLTFLINNNLLFFFVQNFVDFERTINKRYLSQTASAPILRVLIQKSFEKQNQEIPLLKDELIVATNSVASREIMNKVLTDVYGRSDTNVILYETIRDNLNLFPTLQEKLEIVKFPEKKFKDEDEIMFWANLPTNKTIEQLLDLYEQLYNGEAENIQSTQNQINNIENSIETQLYSITNMRIKSKLDEAKEGKRRAIRDLDAIERRRKQDEQDILAAKYERQIEQYKESKAGQKEVIEDLKLKEELKKEGQQKLINNLKLKAQKTRQLKAFEDLKNYRPRVMEYEERQGMRLADEEQNRILQERAQELRVAKANKGRQQTIDPASYLSASKSVPKPRGNLKPNVAIQEQEPISAELVGQEEYITPRKVKSAREPTEEVINKSDIPYSSLKPYLDTMNNITKREDMDNLAKKYQINQSEVRRQYNSTSIGTLKLVIAIKQYEQANTYKLTPIEVQVFDSLNELTRGSYSDKTFIPDPDASISRQPPMEGTGLLTKRQQDSHRFKVLQGQILAGNNSKKIILELKALILKMNKLGEISNKKATAVLQELNSVLK